MISVLKFLRTAIRPASLLLALTMSVSSASAADVHLKVPKRSKPTPVQQLNQEGVKALGKKDIARAKRAFYRAYLLDPDDPFTLNNLGYVAELDGEIDKAQKFYDLSAANGSNAVVALSSDPELKGKEVSQVAGSAVSAPMQINRLNVAAMGLMTKDRAPEAELALRKALRLDPNNPFTLNNLGYALEKEGELEEATHYYTLAANSGSQEKVVVALNRSWRGRTISEVATINEAAANRELASGSSPEAKVARLNLRGVSALNRNQPANARKLFEQAYRIDPNNAFSLNNMGYVAEIQGDRETADFYYEKAREANRSSARIALATRKSLQGMRLGSVAEQNEQFVETAQAKQLAALRAQGVPPLPLRTRDQAVVHEPATPPRPEPEAPVRILAEDNPPPEAAPKAMASSPAPNRSRLSANNSAQPNPVPTTNGAVQTNASVQPPPTPAAAAEPVPTVHDPQDEAPLLPVIPDEVPSK